MEANLGLLQHYQHLLTTSASMLALSKSGRWDELITFKYAQCFGRSSIMKLSLKPCCNSVWTS